MPPDAEVLEEYGLQVLPSLVHFEHGVPASIYSGEMKNDDAILAWITKELQAVDIPEVKPRKA